MLALTSADLKIMAKIVGCSIQDPVAKVKHQVHACVMDYVIV
jgi:hypothetical protein